MIWRGTTPTIKIKVPFATAEIEVAYITVNQCGATVFEREVRDFGSPDMIAAELTQEDTLMLQSDHEAEIQVRGRFFGGKTFASKIIRDSVGRILKEGVI